MIDLPTLLTIHNTYTSVTPNYIHPFFFAKKKLRRSVSVHKCSIRKRNSRIIQLGYSTQWSTFLTLTFNNTNYSSDYTNLQSLFHQFIKSLYYTINSLSNTKTELVNNSQARDKVASICDNDDTFLSQLETYSIKDISEMFSSGDYSRMDKPRLKYLAVIEHGGKTGRVHFHMLTNILYSAPFFQYTEQALKKHLDRKICLLWNNGFSDVVAVNNKNCNAVHYLCKYLTKLNKNRVPIGKREVFSSRGLNPVRRVITRTPLDYLRDMELAVNLNRTLIYYKKKPLIAKLG